MDALCALLRGPRADTAFLLRSSMDPPWCLRIEDEAPLTLVAVIRGHAHLLSDGAAGSTLLSVGDVALLRGPVPYQVADDPATAPQVVIRPGQVCVDTTGGDGFGPLAHSVRSWGNAPDGQTVLLTGTYETSTQVTDRLLRALSAVTVVRRAEWESPLLDVLARELLDDTPGQAAILDRLLDVLCLTAVRACFTRPGANPPRWYTAALDPVIGPALDLIHNNPAHQWTVAGLAGQVGASRAAFARRFTSLVGEPPVNYLTKWRLDLAADRLRHSRSPVASIARDAGYANQFAFSNAFKRHTGVSPTHYRHPPPATSAVPAP